MLKPPTNHGWSLEQVATLLLVVALATYPLDPYRIVGTGLSLYRLAAVSFVVITAGTAIWHGRIRLNTPIILLVVFLAYTGAHYLMTAPHSGWATSKFGAYAFGTVLALAIAQRQSSVPTVLLGIQLAFWVTIPFTVYSLYLFLVRHRIVLELPALPGFTTRSGGWLSQGHAFEGFVRLAAPFPAPQFLGLLAALAAFIALWQVLHDPRGGPVRWFRYVTLGGAAFILLGSLSRSALLPAGLWMAALLAARGRHRETVYRLTAAVALVVLIVVGVSTRLDIGNIAMIAIDRATSASASFSQHLDTRLTALSLWGRSPISILFGTSFGEYGGFWAAEGPHSHSPYTTLLAETGLVGASLLGLLLVALVVKALERVYTHQVMVWLITMITFALLLYEFLALQFVWAVIGAAAAVPPRPTLKRWQEHRVVQWHGQPG